MRNALRKRKMQQGHVFRVFEPKGRQTMPWLVSRKTLPSSRKLTPEGVEKTTSNSPACRICNSIAIIRVLIALSSDKLDKVYNSQNHGRK